MSVGFWVVLGVVVFIIGNVMALKPKIGDVRLGDLRLFARKIHLHPKLSTTPAFIKTSTKMMANYTLIDDRWRLPLVEFTIKDGTWHSDTPHPDFLHLQGQPIDHTLAKYFVALSIRSNSVCLYWRDEEYAKSFGVRDETATATIEKDLLSLKSYLIHLVS